MEWHSTSRSLTNTWVVSCTSLFYFSGRTFDSRSVQTAPFHQSTHDHMEALLLCFVSHCSGRNLLKLNSLHRMWHSASRHCRGGQFVYNTANMPSDKPGLVCSYVVKNRTTLTTFPVAFRWRRYFQTLVMFPKVRYFSFQYQDGLTRGYIALFYIEEKESLEIFMLLHPAVCSAPSPSIQDSGALGWVCRLHTAGLTLCKHNNIH